MLCCVVLCCVVLCCVVLCCALQAISRLKPATVVFNIGTWRYSEEEVWPQEQYDAIFSACQAAVQPQQQGQEEQEGQQRMGTKGSDTGGGSGGGSGGKPGGKGGGGGSTAAQAPASADSSIASSSTGPVGGCIWKTTTWALDEHVQRDFDAAALAAAARHGWRVMDAWALTRPAGALQPPPWVHGDYLHFLGYVYEELNNYLLNMIC